MLSRELNMKGDPSKFMFNKPQTQIFKIKDISRFKCPKEMKYTWFSIDFIVFSLWPYCKEGFES